jgi:predicted lipase
MNTGTTDPYKELLMLTMTNRFDTIINLDTAAEILEKVRNQLQDMACPQYMDDQVKNLLNQLDELRYQVLNEDLAEG